MIPLPSEGYLTPIVLAPTRGSFRHDDMAAKKKKTTTSTSTEANTSAEAPASADHALITTTNGPGIDGEDNSEDTSVDDLADGEFEVELLDMGVASEDIQAMRRIDAHLAEHLRHAWPAAT